MRGTKADRIEQAAGVAAATSLAAAGGFAGYRISAGLTTFAGAVTVGAFAAVAAFVLGKSLLRLLEGSPKPFPQPIFEMTEIEPAVPPAVDELVLTDADRLQPAAEAEPLELDDVLVEMSPNSRVVQLFDPSAMPTPGQLKARIDRHLDGGTSHSPSPDASEALFAALADLRRSLR